MILEKSPLHTITRSGRSLLISLLQPHRVLSTSQINGGMREDLRFLCNHQGSESVGHDDRFEKIMAMGSEAYHKSTCVEFDLPWQETALMCTSANMQCATLAKASFQDLTVQVAATAGVQGNATRAGDKAGWHEGAEGSSSIKNHSEGAENQLQAKEKGGSGTIVTLVLINQPCSAACLVKASTMVTEAKSAALLDLRMPSKQSLALATGTGTDQLAVACPTPKPGEFERQWAGSHNTLGELLAQATHEAITRCLLLQNGVCPELRRSLVAALDRFGCGEAFLKARAKEKLSPTQAALFDKNILAIIHDPQSAAAAYGLAESMDLMRDGILHEEVSREALLNQASLLAAAVASKPEDFALFRKELMTASIGEPILLAADAIILGFEKKWN
ncbi:MAG: adenosylcobinamide amidohydrolase [Planctomycetes bacterium]|nr:adenosylcobinamide amidohydrolase [Planctomycetota bacterium]